MQTDSCELDLFGRQLNVEHGVILTFDDLLNWSTPYLFTLSDLSVYLSSDRCIFIEPLELEKYEKRPARVRRRLIAGY